MDIQSKSIKIVKDDRFLYATMASGEVIPMQIDCIVKQELGTPGIVECLVTLKVYIPIADFEILNIKTDELNK